MASEQLLAQLRFEEGLRLEAYQDTQDVKSIAYGRNLLVKPDFNGQPIPERITPALAEQILRCDVQAAEAGLLQAWPDLAGLDAPRREACVQMAFQLGVQGFMGFRQLRRALLLRDWYQAYAQVLDSLAARQCPRRWRRIAGQILDGEYYQVPLAGAVIKHS